MPRSLLFNHVLLFLCCSIYLGIGVTLVFFQLPLEPLLTPDNYAMIFVRPVANATSFLTYMSILMVITGAVMLFSEWFSGIRWVPVVVLLCLVAATALTVVVLFPLNKELTEGISDPARLRIVFHEWAAMNRVRASIWAIQWAAMMYWFARLAYEARSDR